MAPTFVDLFCGIGGFRIGLEAAGFECVYANDINDAAVETYKNNRSPNSTYPIECADIREVFEHRLNNIPSHHVLAAGFPCQPFTREGNRLGNSCPLHGDLGQFVVKIAAAKRPAVVLLENVPTFFDIAMPWCNALEHAFKQVGYACHHNSLSAWDFGLPQNRTRGFIVAVRDDVHVPFQFPLPPPGNPVTIRDSLLAAESTDLIGFKKLRQDETQIKWRKSSSAGLAWKDILDEVPDDLRTHTGIICIGQMGQQPGKLSGRFYHDLGHFPCITSSVIPKAWVLTRGTDGQGTIVRKLHTRELCRIQGFPDDFKFGKINNLTRNKQIGNSVPPPMAEWIGRAVAEQYREAFSEGGNVDENDEENAGHDPKRKKSSRKHKSHRKPGHKPKRRSRHHSRRKSRHRRNHKSRGESRERSREQSRDQLKSTGKTSRKRKLSSDLSMAPPTKRQHRQSAASPDEEPEVSPSLAGVDGNVEE